MKFVTCLNNVLQLQLEQDGIATIQLLNADDIQALLTIYQTTLSLNNESNFYSTMFIKDATHRKKVDDQIRAVIEPKLKQHFKDYRLLFSNFIVKQSSPDTRVDIHQDWNFSSPEFASANIWIPLLNINEQTGLFYALKGSHKKFKNIRYTPFPNNAYAHLKDIILKRSDSFNPKAGEALVYDGAIVHFSEPNTSGKVRIAIGSVLIPKNAPCQHYYKREPATKTLEVYNTDEAFYNSFNFYEEPEPARKTGEINDYIELPLREELL